MSADPVTAAEAQAIDWIVRQRAPDFDDWDGFADWLAEDPGHAEIYDALASLDVDLAALPPTAPSVSPANDPADDNRSTPRRWWLGGAVAAAIFGVVALPSFDLSGSRDVIQTAAGEHRTITLADGSRIEINGGSTLQLDKDRPRFARLESGEAMFHVVHRSDSPFVVETGGTRIVDLGTAFNVVRADNRIAVAVSEGIVLYSPDRAKLRLVAGQAIDARDGDTQPPRIRRVDTATVGGWRSGLLVYDGASLQTVADDLKRTAGISVQIDPSASRLSFRGTLVVDKGSDRTVADLAALSGAKAERRGDGWVVSR
ncbi:FecR family protein [Sphingopyxis terrae]|uniref:FecR family protein n=1 Tax=Sphingopyxis terrae subsp. ummariensis TaxID=429001 RepID=A0A1Y6FU64_9SPHN|nr:FecR domain-containing protein [Sphingopyxis terrae]PCF90889.1 iron dicitrate transport regulator FecR [Sphingopyxis terrae subsp. ummariensis]SMQ79113.1 FecR family protein [Sphingopyxis terrae subsp. ummariensis]